MTQKVTKRQQAVLDCIEACIQDKGYGPTVREICQSLGLSSPSTVHVHLKALEEKGLIKRDPLKSRSSRRFPPLSRPSRPPIASSSMCPWWATWPPAPLFSPRRTSPTP